VRTSGGFPGVDPVFVDRCVRVRDALGSAAVPHAELRASAALAESAVYGAAARRLIMDELEALQTPVP
jgi:hypothetical protein